MDGVGEADVMITVKSSEEKVFRVDRSVSGFLHGGDGFRRGEHAI